MRGFAIRVLYINQWDNFSSRRALWSSLATFLRNHHTGHNMLPYMAFLIHVPRLITVSFNVAKQSKMSPSHAATCSPSDRGAGPLLIKAAGLSRSSKGIEKVCTDDEKGYLMEKGSNAHRGKFYRMYEEIKSCLPVVLQEPRPLHF